MKGRIFPVILTLLVTTYCKAQVAVQTELQKIVYYGIENPLMIAASGYKDSEIEVSASNGTIRKSGGPGSYTLAPEKVGNITILVKAKVGGKMKEIGATSCSVRQLPVATSLGGLRQGACLSQNYMRRLAYIHQ